jgi:hypothetical protein
MNESHNTGNRPVTSSISPLVRQAARKPPAAGTRRSDSGGTLPRLSATGISGLQAGEDVNRMLPPGVFPLKDWSCRLSDQDDRCRLATHLAIHGWLVDMAGGGQRVANRE